jgi:hypothetical protein
LQLTDQKAKWSTFSASCDTIQAGTELDCGSPRGK